jgi:hypothetical protein
VTHNWVTFGRAIGHISTTAIRPASYAKHASHLLLDFQRWKDSKFDTARILDEGLYVRIIDSKLFDRRMKKLQKTILKLTVIFPVVVVLEICGVFGPDTAFPVILLVALLTFSLLAIVGLVRLRNLPKRRALARDENKPPVLEVTVDGGVAALLAQIRDHHRSREKKQKFIRFALKVGTFGLSHLLPEGVETYFVDFIADEAKDSYLEWIAESSDAKTESIASTRLVKPNLIMDQIPTTEPSITAARDNIDLLWEKLRARFREAPRPVEVMPRELKEVNVGTDQLPTPTTDARDNIDLLWAKLRARSRYRE